VAAFAGSRITNASSLAGGLPVALLASPFAGWAAGTWRRTRRGHWRTNMRTCSNPLYLGTMLVAAGLAIAGAPAVGLGGLSC